MTIYRKFYHLVWLLLSNDIKWINKIFKWKLVMNLLYQFKVKNNANENLKKIKKIIKIFWSAKILNNQSK